MQYRIIRVEDETFELAMMNLEKKVQSALYDGWKLQGGINSIKCNRGEFGGNFFVSQAVYKN
jgi:hypothetical protein